MIDFLDERGQVEHLAWRARQAKIRRVKTALLALLTAIAEHHRHGGILMPDVNAKAERLAKCLSHCYPVDNEPT